MISLKMRTLTMTMPSAIAATPPIRKPSSVSSVVSQTCCGNHGAVNRITSPSQTRLGAGRTSGDTSSGRLVREDERRVDPQPPAGRGGLLPAARELARVRAFAALEPHEPQDVARFLGGGAAFEPEDLDRQQHVLEDGAPREEHRRLEHHPDAPARPGDLRRTDADVPGAGVEQPADQLEQRRLAAAAPPDESSGLPRQG